MDPVVAICISVGTAAIGWVVGFVSSVGGTYFLERRRAFRAVIGACHSVEARLMETSEFPHFHAWSLSILDVPFFAGIGFLNCEDQKDARNAWDSYQRFKSETYLSGDFLDDFSAAKLHVDMTQQDAMRIEIAKIRAIFTKFP
jgi:hypothetical protein